ncbi:MAG TPA: FAD-dependent monooxygenase, partial [Polyangiaceae bacterium]
LSSPERARADVKKQLPGWSPALLRFVDEANDTIVPRPIVTLPPGHSWTHRAGITLLGDAAHVMPPFSGEGVNMAMLDATELAAAIAEGTDDAIEAYEKAMFVRAGEAARGAIEGCDFVSDDALAHTIAHFEEITRAGDRSA